MRTRKLLIITLYFPPCASVATHRMLGLARYLPNYDWDTVVVAPPKVMHEATDFDLLQLIPSEHNTLYSVPFTEGFIGKIERKFFPHYLWSLQARQACIKAIEEHKPDAVLTSFPPACIHKLGLWIKKTYQLPWIADFRDPWMTPEGRIQPVFKKLFNTRAEQKTIQSAELVVVTSPTYAKGLQEVYSDAAQKIVTITNGFDPNNFPHYEAFPLKERVSLLYTGALYVNRNPLGLLDALSELQLSQVPNMPKLGFHIIGSIDADDYNIMTEIKMRGLEEVVTIENFKPYKECLIETTKADILILIQTEGYANAIPAKLFEYIGAKRPILVLANPPGDIAWVLKESGVLHRIAPVRDSLKIKQAIIELISEIQSKKPIVTSDVKIHSFTREGMASQFAQHLNKIVCEYSEGSKNDIRDAIV